MVRDVGGGNKEEERYVDGGQTEKSVDVIRASSEKQETYMLHRPVEKRFVSNSFTVTNVMNVWAWDVQPYAKYDDTHRYFLSVIDVFSKFLHMSPVKTKSGPYVATVFRSIFDDPRYSRRKRRPVWVGTDKGKEFLN